MRHPKGWKPDILPDEPLDPVLPLKAAAERWKAAHIPPQNTKGYVTGRAMPKPPKEVKPRNPVNAGVAIGMRAAGIPNSRIASVFGTGVDAVKNAIARVPNAQGLILEYREALKVLKIQKAHALENKLWNRAELEIDEGEAKGVDAIFRALHASEKIQASASGEGTRVDLHQTSENPVADVKILIAQLLNES